MKAIPSEKILVRFNSLVSFYVSSSIECRVTNIFLFLKRVIAHTSFMHICKFLIVSRGFSLVTFFKDMNMYLSTSSSVWKNTTQSQFFSEVVVDWIQNFPSPRPVVLPQLRGLVISSLLLSAVEEEMSKCLYHIYQSEVKRNPLCPKFGLCSLYPFPKTVTQCTLKKSMRKLTSFGLILWHIKHYRLFNATFILKNINSSVSSNSNSISIIIIIMSCRQHGYPWPSLATSPDHPSLLAGLQGYMPYPHIAAVCMFELVVLLLLGRMQGSIGVHHWWVRPCFSSSVLRVWFV